ncbi:ABC transporter substrate-binding protein [Streptomyces sp. ISL-98]|uniref:ABC transporter substrate-binding protein n=1 Tax=Streptomyces sp. ISL-98 TaxID=2819192 RepID=UPI001BEB0BC2|nr:ABC transporter substrate-binding protein [Streptomyces sp. ISL-98]MBT2506045.1 ABC transporter substrate-binding protein [Streptomyces sp. ISL-98]
MRTTTTTGAAAAAIAAIGLATTGCSGGVTGGGGSGTVTIAIASDPGTLNPLGTVASSALSMNRFAYDTLVHRGPKGSTVPGIAQRWSATPTSATFTLRKGVTCQDGSALTASDVAAVYNYVADPKNQSPLLGVAVPPTATAKADDARRTVTVRTKQPAPFFVEMAQLLPLTCKKGLSDPKALARASDATGAYRLKEAVAGDHFTYVKRKGYTWGPDGATGDEMPDTVVFKVVANESTATNLLLAGEVNAAQINGTDRDRLEAAKVMSRSTRLLFGELIFNEGSGHPTADPAVRKALVGALDLKQIGSVATGGTGKPATNLGEIAPTPCTGDTVTGNLPAHDTARAAEALTSAGWKKTGKTWTKDGKPLSITAPYPSTQGPRVSSAMELAAQQWTEFGVMVTTRTMDQATVVSTLSADTWDVAWSPIGVSLPDQLTRFFDGPVPPRGTNFGRVDNPEYQRLTAEAATKPGKAGCDLWDAADAALIKRVDVVPIVTNPQTVYGKGVTFRSDGGIVPSSLRRTSG